VEFHTILILSEDNKSVIYIDLPIKEYRNIPYMKLRKAIEKIYGSDMVKKIEKSHISATNSNTYFIFV
jgi:hypothetical protein